LYVTVNSQLLRQSRRLVAGDMCILRMDSRAGRACHHLSTRNLWSNPGHGLGWLRWRCGCREIQKPVSQSEDPNTLAQLALPAWQSCRCRI